MRKLLIAAAVLLAVHIGLSFVRPAGAVTEPADGALTVGIVFDVGGRGDKSFNDGAYLGAERAERELGAVTRAGTEVVGGLRPGIEVVTTGAFLLKTEILKESIGAGCCEDGGE